MDHRTQPAALILAPKIFELLSEPLLIHFGAPEADAKALLQSAAAMGFVVAGVIALTAHGIRTEARPDCPDARYVMPAARQKFADELAAAGISTQIATA